MILKKGTRFLLVVFTLCTSCAAASDKTNELILPNDPLIQYAGRIDTSQPNNIRFSHTGVSIKARFTGNSCTVRLRNYTSGDPSYKNGYAILIDNAPPLTWEVGASDSVFQLPLTPQKEHTVTIFKRTESLVGHGIFEGLMLEKGHTLLPLPAVKRRIEFIGNSITCGYGNEGTSPACHFSPATENGYMAYGALTARKLDAAYLAVAYSGKGVVQNYNLDDKLTLPDAYDRIFPEKPEPLWNPAVFTPDVVVINLGTNDFAHFVPDSALFVNTYIAFVSKLRNQYPKAHLFCIEGGMTRDGWPKGQPSFTIVKRYIQAASDHLHRKGDSHVYSFFVQPAETKDLGCDYHPNIVFHEKMAHLLSAFIQKKTGWK